MHSQHFQITTIITMPKGRQAKASHKGRGRHFLTEEEVRASEEKKQREKEWKRKKGIVGQDSDESDESDIEEPSHGQPGDLPPSDSEEETSSDDDDKKDKHKGVEGLIEVENPNRVAKKSVKARDIDVNAKVQLSRKEREEIERQRAHEAHRKLHEAGKTEEARKDLARLAIIRQQREEAAKKKEAERKAKEAAEAKKKK